MRTSIQEIYTQIVSTLPLTEQLQLANLILNELVAQDLSVIDRSDRWTDRDRTDLANFSLQYAAMLFSEDVACA